LASASRSAAAIVRIHASRIHRAPPRRDAPRPYSLAGYVDWLSRDKSVTICLICLSEGSADGEALVLSPAFDAPATKRGIIIQIACPPEWPNLLSQG
jgi:hypothetical protein